MPSPTLLDGKKMAKVIKAADADEAVGQTPQPQQKKRRSAQEVRSALYGEDDDVAEANRKANAIIDARDTQLRNQGKNPEDQVYAPSPNVKNQKSKK